MQRIQKAEESEMELRLYRKKKRLGYGIVGFEGWLRECLEGGLIRKLA